MKQYLRAQAINWFNDQPGERRVEITRAFRTTGPRMPTALRDLDAFDRAFCAFVRKHLEP